MPFEAHYRKSKLVGLATIGLVFAAGGLWMALQPDGSFDDARKIRSLASLFGAGADVVGHGIGWAGVLLGLGCLPVVVRQLRFEGPAIRVDEHGVYWHRWSPKPIGWDNVAAIRPYAVYNQKMVGLELRDPSVDPSTTLLGRAARLNRSLGFAQVSITAQGTDADFDELLDAMLHHTDLHARRQQDQDDEPSARPEFGLRSAG